MTPKDPPRTQEQDDEERRQKLLRDVQAEWDRKLKWLNDPDAHDKIEAIFAARGKLKNPPKAGETF